MQSYFYIERSTNISILPSAAQYVSAFSGTTTSINSNIKSSSNGDLTWDNTNWRINVNRDGYYLFSVALNYTTDQGTGNNNTNGFVNLYVDSTVSQKKPFSAIEETDYGRDFDYFHFIHYYLLL